MPRFSYRAIDKEGKRLSGHLEETSHAAVVDALRARGQLPIEISPSRWEKSRMVLAGLMPEPQVSSSQLAIATREIARLLGAGIGVQRAFDLVARTGSHKAVATAAGKVVAQLNRGVSLAAALQIVGDPFNQTYVSLVEAGEAAGQLPEVMTQLATDLQQRERLRSGVATAMIYPSILFVLSVGALAMVLAYVVPEFAALMGGNLGALPWATRMVIGLSDAVLTYGPVACGVAVLLAAGFVLWIRRPEGRLAWDGLKLRLPGLGSGITKTAMARFCRMMATLTANGVRVPVALGMAQGAVGNVFLGSAFAAARNDVERGSALALALANTNALPDMITEMIAAGEEAGQLDRMFADLAGLYEEQSNLFIQRTLAVLEPALILGLGALVGGIIISILVGVMSVNDIALQ